MSMKEGLKQLLRRLADKYETADFLNGDPSWFMHQVEGDDNREAVAFVASVLSYGSRKQFLPKIQSILNASGNDVHNWIKDGNFEDFMPERDASCFYRLYTVSQMNLFLKSYRKLMLEHGTLGGFVAHGKSGSALDALRLISGYFSSQGVGVIIPKDTTSACKRLCMFLRWMVRRDSPVDLGLWSGFIDRRTLIMPLDTHVMQQASELGLMKSRTATMSSALALTRVMLEVFPDDPLRGDFALFGLGVSS